MNDSKQKMYYDSIAGNQEECSRGSYVVVHTIGKDLLVLAQISTFSLNSCDSFVQKTGFR